MSIRKLAKDDYEEYIRLIKQFRPITDHVSKDKFHTIYDKIFSSGCIYVYILHEKIIGSVTVIIEHKFIHNCSIYLHIEDVFVLEKYRGEGIGSKLIQKVIEVGKDLKAYKIILTCGKDNIQFYEKNHFEKRDIQMSLLL